MKPTLDQQRAEYAWGKAAAEHDDNYCNLAKAAPALIMANGLMQTLAFYNEKSKPHHRRLLEHILSWLCRTNGTLSNVEPKFDSVIKALYLSQPEAYRNATEETLAVLRWLRQFAGMGKD